MNFAVNQYHINHYSDKKNTYDAIIFLQNADKSMHVTVHFVPSDRQVRDVSFNANETHALVYIHTDFLPHFIHLLRYEGPIYCRGNANLTPFLNIKSGQEHPGDGES